MPAKIGQRVMILEIIYNKNNSTTKTKQNVAKKSQKSQRVSKACQSNLPELYPDVETWPNLSNLSINTGSIT